LTCKKRKGRERGKREEVEVAGKRRENARLDCLLIFIFPFFPFLVFKGRERAAHLFLSPASSTTRSHFCFLSRARREKEKVLRDRERSAEKKKTSPFFSLANDINSRAVLLLLKRGGLLVIP